MEIYESNYGMQDVRTCKIKRNVALVYLRGTKFEEALKELQEVEDLEKYLYGELSSQIAKTFKIIGTLMIIMRNSPDTRIVNMDEARDYLMQAHAIFEQRGMLRQLRETKQKIKLLSQASHQDQISFVQDEINGLE